MQPEIQLAQALVDILTFFMPGFVVMLVIEWAVGLFRRDG